VVQAMRGLSEREQAMNRADLMKRVFDLKKKQLMGNLLWWYVCSVSAPPGCGRSNTKSGDSS
jgi:hypothetical protein